MLGHVTKIGVGAQSTFHAGFLTHLYLLRTVDVTYMTELQGDSLILPTASFEVHPDAEIVQIRIRPKTATFSESSAQGADGIAFSSVVSLPLKGPAPDVTAWVFKNSKQRFVLLARDTMGQCYIAGSKENGARISWARAIGSTSDHSLNFSMTSWHPVQFIPTIDLEVLLPEGDFDTSFDFSFS